MWFYTCLCHIHQNLPKLVSITNDTDQDREVYVFSRHSSFPCDSQKELDTVIPSHTIVPVYSRSISFEGVKVGIWVSDPQPGESFRECGQENIDSGSEIHLSHILNMGDCHR